MVSWAWLTHRSEPNGVLAALTALQPDAAETEEKTPTPPLVELPPAVRWVLLLMELALVGGGGFLLLLTSSVITALVRGLLSAAGDGFALEGVVVRVCEAAAFAWGLVVFMGWFFRVHKRDLVRRLSGFGWRSGKTCMVSVLLHSVAVVVFTSVWTWENVWLAAYRSDGSLATAELMQNLLLAPMKEELFFRGVVVLVAVNRLQSVKWGAWISSVLFAAIHLANARHLGMQYSASYVVFQVLWALLVGGFLALKLAVSGSLTECIALHTINNIFALGVAKNVAMDMTQPGMYTSMLASIAIYAVVIAKQLQALQRTTLRDKEL
ncbi:putative peptidase family U48 [Phytophthora cinnamomi]|uniref:putative peptidase family U48 n=1 Tax=Phytophthora cinnamomi TaxID=4785 RepID=UPI00355AAD2B|nr:putative peptidase family U48 [Phytophthora cinnamomi]